MTGPLSSVRLTPLISAKRLQGRIRQLGKQISHHFAGKDPLVLVVMDGASFFATDLTRAINLPALRMEFISAASYHGGTESTRAVQLNELPQCEGQDIILIDDILDTGHTLNAIYQALEEAKIGSIYSCILLDKPSGREIPFLPDLIGFTVPNAFLVGYGLDFQGRMRNLPDIHIAQVE